MDTFFSVLNILGTIAFAFSGAIAAKKNGADIFGLLTLSLVASSFGGITRDLLIGSLPPDLLRSNLNLILSLGSGLFTYFFWGLVNKMVHPIDFFDAIGLGLFAVVGASKALSFGISPVWSVGMGLITAVGGGMIRDIMLARVPFILTSELYATPAILGATILVAGQVYFPQYEKFSMLAGAAICCGIRLLAIRYRWSLPK